LLKKAHHRIGTLEGFGVSVRPEYAGLSMGKLEQQVEKEILVLTQAHAERYRVS
jgi:hypothetical protein